MDWLLAAFGVVVCLSYVVQTATGFGSMLICVSFGVLFLPLEQVLLLALPLSLLQSGYVAARHRVFILWKLLFRQVLPLMGLGLAVGVWLAVLAPEALLKPLLGLLVVLLALRELYRLGRAAAEPKALGRALALPIIFFAGITHGVFATGGPLLVYVLSRLGLSKQQFRSTLACVWFSMNSALLLRFLWAGRYELALGAQVLWLVLAVPLGIFLGEKIHQHVNERRFKQIVYGVLCAVGMSLLLGA